MYNSKVIALLSTIWQFIVDMYNYSFLKKIVDKVALSTRRLADGSVLINATREDSLVLENSLIYKLYKFISKSFNKLIDKLSASFNKLNETSFIVARVRDLSASLDNMLASLAIFLIAFFVFLLVFKSYFVGFEFGIFQVFSLLTIFLVTMTIRSVENLEELLNTSWIVNKFMYLISIEDEEGSEQWW